MGRTNYVCSRLITLFPHKDSVEVLLFCRPWVCRPCLLEPANFRPHREPRNTLVIVVVCSIYFFLCIQCLFLGSWFSLHNRILRTCYLFQTTFIWRVFDRVCWNHPFSTHPRGPRNTFVIFLFSKYYFLFFNKGLFSRSQYSLHKDILNFRWLLFNPQHLCGGSHLRPPLIVSTVFAGTTVFRIPACPGTRLL